LPRNIGDEIENVETENKEENELVIDEDVEDVERYSSE